MNDRVAEEPDQLIDEVGERWRVDETALLGPDGTSLKRMPGALAYWFGWHSFHPRTELHRPKEQR